MHMYVNFIVLFDGDENKGSQSHMPCGNNNELTISVNEFLFLLDIIPEFIAA